MMGKKQERTPRRGGHDKLESIGIVRRLRRLGRLPERRYLGLWACKVMSWDSKVFP